MPSWGGMYVWGECDWLMTAETLIPLNFLLPPAQTLCGVFRRAVVILISDRGFLSSYNSLCDFIYYLLTLLGEEGGQLHGVALNTP